MSRSTRRGQRLSSTLLATALLAGSLSGCGGAEVTVVDDVTVLIGARSSSGMDALLPGRLAVVDGCLGLDFEDGAVFYVVVWPHGTEVVRDSPLTLALPDGEEHQLGDQLQVGGGESSSRMAGGIDVDEECPGAAVWLGSD
ncbi:MAG: hypothetical protein KKE65_03765 [Actinobacteria bacterium]|jgi:hypothetical protein|nr:hypothetical protein [Actinomycetota bacterium]MBU2110755.1 hypothetical protein [Actinomycetota bacterium]